MIVSSMKCISSAPSARSSRRGTRKIRVGHCPPDRLDHAIEVLRGAKAAEGKSLADELFMSHATAKTHVSRLLTKLDARDRAQLVMVAYESGVVIPGSG